MICFMLMVGIYGVLGFFFLVVLCRYVVRKCYLKCYRLTQPMQILQKGVFGFELLALYVHSFDQYFTTSASILLVIQVLHGRQHFYQMHIHSISKTCFPPYFQSTVIYVIFTVGGISAA